MPIKLFLSLAFTLLCGGACAQNVAYVANQLSASVAVIDGATNTVVQTIPVGGAPVHLALSPDAARLYVGLGSQIPTETKLVVINVPTNTVIDTVPVPFSPGSMAITPDGSHAWVIKDNNTSRVALVNLTTKLIEAEAVTGSFPIDVNISPDGTRLYVSNNSANNVSVIDTATRATAATIPTAGFPSGLVLSPAGGRLWIVNQVGSVTVVDTSSNSVLTTIQVPSGAFSGDLSVDGSRLYVGHAGSGSGMPVIDAVSNTLITTVPVGNLQVWAVGVTETGSRIFGSLPTGNAVAVFDATTNSLITTVPVGSFPFALAVPKHKLQTPAVGLSTSALFFGKQLIGATSAAQALVLTNTGAAPLSIGSIAAAGPFVQTSQCGASLALGASCTIAVTFSPLTLGPQNGTITITDNATPTMQTITLSGTGEGVFAPREARVHIGLANSDDVGIRFDLRAEVYRNSTYLVGQDELSSVPGGSSGFNNSHEFSIPLSLTGPAPASSGDIVSIRLLARNACSGSGKNSGRARLWYNDSGANSGLDANVAGQQFNLFLIDGAQLGSTPGAGPKKTVDVAAGAKCSPYQSFGAWSSTLP